MIIKNITYSQFRIFSPFILISLGIAGALNTISVAVTTDEVLKERLPILDFDPVCGGVTPDSAFFVFGLQFFGDTAKVVLSKQSTFCESIYSEEVIASDENAGIAKIKVSGLEPDTLYYYNVEVNGNPALTCPQSFRTFPIGEASFRFTFGNSLRLNRENQNGMLASIKDDPLFFLNTGDLHYRDLIASYASPYREAIQAVFETQVHRAAMKNTPLVYMFDDHDYGPNDSDRTAPGRSLSIQAYKLMTPHYHLVFPEGDDPITQVFSVGRVRFILTDLRSQRSPKSDPDGPSKTMMGTLQREWFLSELMTAAKTHAMVIWVSTVPWIQSSKDGVDQWGGYSHERELIANFIAENKINNLVIIGGDAHSLSADNGSHSDYSSGRNMPLVPEIIASPLDNDSTSVKGGPYSAGVYEPEKGENVYGLVEIIDRGDQITMKFSGKNNKNKTMLELEHTISVNL